MQSIGEIRIFAGPFAPRDWLELGGGVLDVSANSALLAVVGFDYGWVGPDRFRLPNLVDSIPVGAKDVGSFTNFEAWQPSQPLARRFRHIIATNGVFGILDGFLGEIQFWPGSRLPEGWLAADGSVVDRDRHPDLHALLARATDGSEARLPNLMGHAAVPRGGFGAEHAPFVRKRERELQHAVGPCTVGMSPIICAHADQAPEGMVGEIRMFSGPSLPAGYQPCHGQALDFEEYFILGATLEGQFGPMTESAFQVPDLRGRLIGGLGRQAKAGSSFSAEPGDHEVTAVPLSFGINYEGLFPARP